MTVNTGHNSKAKRVVKYPHKYKTQMCRHGANCKYMRKECYFAHTVEELVIVGTTERAAQGWIPDAIHFRTLPCYRFICVGECRYFDKCCFLHDPRIGCGEPFRKKSKSSFPLESGVGQNKSTRDYVMCWPEMKAASVKQRVDVYGLPDVHQKYRPVHSTGLFERSWDIFTRICSGVDAECVDVPRLPVFEELTA